MKKIWIVVALLSFAAVGATVWLFDEKSLFEQIVEDTDFISHSDHLALIPADTLFYMGSLKPLNGKDLMASMSPIYRLADPTIWHEVNKEQMEQLSDKAASPGAKFAVSLFNFFMNGLADPQRLFEQTGAKETLFSSVYTVGLMPVLRYESDRDDFAKFIDTLETDAGITARIKKLQGVEYRSYPLSEEGVNALELVVAHHAGDAIFTLAMAEADQQNLFIALGLEKPDSSLRDTGAVQQLKKDYQYLPDALGYISVKQVTSALTSDNNRAGVALAALDNGRQTLFNQIRSPACAAEFAEIAEVWPRWVTGYRELEYSEKGFSGEFHMNIEINHAALAATLQKIRGHLPADLTSGVPQIASMAIGLDVSKLDEILGELASLAFDLQYQCVALQQLNGMDEIINNLRPMIAVSTAMARSLKGLRVSLFDIEGDLTTGKVSSIDGMLTLSGEQIRGFINIMLAMNPDVGVINLPENGSPVPLPMLAEIISKTVRPLQIMLAAKQDQAVFFVGDTAANLYADALDEAFNEDGFLFFSMDYGKYMKLLSGVMDETIQSAEISEEEKAELASFRRAIEAINYQEQMRMQFTDKGIEIIGRLDIHNQ